MTVGAAVSRSNAPEFLGALFVMAIAAVVVITIIGAIVSARHQRGTFLDAAARRLKGTAHAAGVLRHPRIEFPLAGLSARVEFVPPGEEDRGVTRVRVPLAESPGTLHIFKESLGQVILKMFGAQDLPVGDRAFDADYVVKATPESLVKQVFSPQRRAQVIAAVRRLEGMPRHAIHVTRDQLRVEVHEEIRNQEVLLRLVQTAGDFLEFLRAAAPVVGIELGELRPGRGASCPVCGTLLSPPAVRCESCATPHHAECWTYVGQCSTYACSGKRWTS